MIQFPRWLPDVTDEDCRRLVATDVELYLPALDRDALRQEFDRFPRNPRELRTLIRGMWGLNSQSERYRALSRAWRRCPAASAPTLCLPLRSSSTGARRRDRSRGWPPGQAATVGRTRPRVRSAAPAIATDRVHEPPRSSSTRCAPRARPRRRWPAPWRPRATLELDEEHGGSSTGALGTNVARIRAAGDPARGTLK
jgi:hypothetical protein